MYLHLLLGKRLLSHPTWRFSCYSCCHCSALVPLCSLSNINLLSPALKFRIKFVNVLMWFLVIVRNASSSSSFGVGLPRTVCAFESGLSVLDITPYLYPCRPSLTALRIPWSRLFMRNTKKKTPSSEWTLSRLHWACSSCENAIYVSRLKPKI